MNPSIDATMTAAEFVRTYAHVGGVELIDGKVVWAGRERNPPAEGIVMPAFRHGVVLNRVAHLLTQFIDEHRLGWTATGDAFVQTRTDPERVRGADFLFVSYARLPAGPTPENLDVVPDLVVEIRSPSDRQSAVLAKVSEYLAAGVRVVVVIDPRLEAAATYRDDEFQQLVHNGDTFTLPDVLPGFAVPVSAFFARKERP